MTRQPFQILCSTGAFSRYPDRTYYAYISDFGPELTMVDGFEVMIYPSWHDDVEYIAPKLLATGLRFPALHVEKASGPHLVSKKKLEKGMGWYWLEQSCLLAKLLGAKTVIYHLWGPPTFDKKIEKNLAVLGRCLDIADKFELRLAIETVPCRKADPLTHIRAAMELDKRCFVALDTEFLALHNQLDAAMQADWLWQDRRVCHVHIKDYAKNMDLAEANFYRPYLHPGEGSIDFPSFFAALRGRDFDGNISFEASAVEQEGQVDIEKLKRSLYHLRELAENA